jgi:hypothetical protein
MLAYLMSGHAGIKTFALRSHSSRIWQVAGFAIVPNWKTVYNHLVRLEDCHEAFIDAANKLIRMAKKHEPAIGRHVHFDGTAYHSHARLEHACPDGTCPGGQFPQQLPRAHHEQIKEEHQQHDALPEEGAEDDPELMLEEADAPPEHGESRGQYRYFWYGPEGGRHLYRTLDRTAGGRTYTKLKKKTWTGGLKVAATDYFTNMSLTSEAIGADTTEHHTYERLFERLREATGCDPVAVTADRGFSVNRIFEFNTRRGVGSVFPWKEPKPGLERIDFECDEYDRHGLPRCQWCGAGAELSSIQFVVDDYDCPRLRFRCGLPHTDECQRHEQSIPCERNWRLLLPLNPADPNYAALRKLQQNHETIHDSERDRYMLAGNELANRVKRFQSQPVQQLRLAVGLFLDWFRACLRNGWLGSHRRRNQKTPYVYSDDTYRDHVLEARDRHALLIPYGSRAVELGLADDPRSPGQVASEEKKSKKKRKSKQ